MQAQIRRDAIRERVRHRIRKKIRGTAQRPRVAVFRSVKHIYAQAIDDAAGRTLAHASSLEPAMRAGSKGGNVPAAKTVGQTLAGRLKEAGVESVVFDRGGFVYSGRVAALAQALREAGIKL